MVEFSFVNMVWLQNLHFQNCYLANSVIFQEEIHELMLFDFSDNYKMNCKLKM